MHRRILPGARLTALILSLAVATAVLAPSREAHAKSAWSIGFGALLGIKPSATPGSASNQAKAAFAIAPQSEWQIVDFFWFAWGSRFAVNGKYFGWAMEPGFLFKIDAGYNLFPTLRAQFLFTSQTFFDSWSTFPVYIGSAFGPGLRYRFESVGLFVDVGFEVAKEMRYSGKNLYFAVVPVLGLEF